MKLEMKHLAPYLPYSLKVIMEGKKCNVAWMSTKNIAVHRPYGIGDYKRINWKYAHLNIKPILRPLSDLFNEVYYDKYEIKRVLIKDHSVILSLSEEDFKEDAELNTYYHSNIRDNYEIITSLFELHFDVFRLIEKGLAIDINTIEKQNIQKVKES